MWKRLRDDAGQTAAEYMGVLLIVSVIVAAVATTDTGSQIGREMQRIICEIFGGDCGQDEASTPPPRSTCVVAAATDKITVSGEFDIKLVTVKLEGGVEYTRQKRANGQVAMTFKLNENGGVGEQLKKLVDVAVKGGPAASVTFVLPDDAAANRFAGQIKDSAKALALAPLNRFGIGGKPHIDFPPIESVTYEQTAGASAGIDIDESGGYANGSLEAGVTLGVKKNLISGELTTYYKVNGKGQGAAGLPLVGPGFTGALAGDLTLAVTWDSHMHPTKLSLTGTGGYEGGMEFAGSQKDLMAALRYIDAIKLKANSRSGKRLEFQIDLSLGDPEVQSLALAFVRGVNPMGGIVDRVQAGRRIWDVVQRKGQIQMRHYDTDASTQSIGLDVEVASGGIAHDTTSAELTGAEDYKPGEGFLPSLVCVR